MQIYMTHEFITDVSDLVCGLLGVCGLFLIPLCSLDKHREPANGES